jgi:CRISPR-associated protein Cas5d
LSVFTLEVWGDFACFTRPEFKVERFSYPVITPSAARAIFDAIYIDFDKEAKKRPVFRWEIRKVTLLKAPQYIALMRNEVKEKISERNVQGWMRDPSQVEPIYADATEEAKGRTQRQTMALKDVKYQIEAEAVLFREDYELRKKIEGSFARRAHGGQCFYQPYLGCREFTAYFRLLNEAELGENKPVPFTESVGWMLYDVFDLSRPGINADKPRISIFDASIQNGVLEIPPYLDVRVLKPEMPSGLDLGGLFSMGDDNA